MTKKFLLFAAAGYSIFWASAYATTITVDLGSPGRVTGEKIVSFTDTSDMHLNGQVVSLDLVFSGNSFVRLFQSTSSSFLLLPMLDVFGSGTINDPTGSGYLFDKNGNPISSVTTFGGSVTTDPGGEAVRLALGGFFPLLASGNGPFPLDIYGAHLDITMPNNGSFNVTGGELGLFPNASKYWQNRFQIGDVPDSGSALFLVLIGSTLLFAFRIAMLRCA